MENLVYFPGIDPETHMEAYEAALAAWRREAYNFHIIAAEEHQRMDKVGRHRAAIFEHLAELSKIDPEESQVLYCEIWAQLYGEECEDSE